MVEFIMFCKKAWCAAQILPLNIPAKSSKPNSVVPLSLSFQETKEDVIENTRFIETKSKNEFINNNCIMHEQYYEKKYFSSVELLDQYTNYPFITLVDYFYNSECQSIRRMMSINKDTKNDKSCKLIVDYQMNIAYIPSTILICMLTKTDKKDIEYFMEKTVFGKKMLKINIVAYGSNKNKVYDFRQPKGIRGYIFVNIFD